MGKKLNLSHLSEEECEQILAVIQRDFDLRSQEQERLHKIEEEIKEERTKDTILSKEKNFKNEDCCMRCLSGFVFLFRRRLQCDKCRYWVCKDCCTWEDSKKVYICNVCEKEVALEKQSHEWFYLNVQKKFKRFGSAKVVRSLHKRKRDTSQSLSYANNTKRKSLFAIDWEADDVDSGYDPSQSIYSTIQSEREKRVRSTVQGLFSSTQSSNRSVGKDGSSASDGSEMENGKDGKRRSSFDSVCSKETERFKEELQDVVKDLEQALDESLRNTGSGAHEADMDNEVLTSFQEHISSALRDLAQALHLAVDNQNPGDTEYPVTKHHEVEHILTHHVEGYLADALDLGADDVPPPDTINSTMEYEDILAKAIVQKIKKKRSEPQTKRESKEHVKSKHQSKKPVPPAIKIVADEDAEMEEPPQSPVRKALVPQESTDEVDFSQLEHATRKREMQLPTFNIHDDGAMDPDLLATNTETEDDMGDFPDNSSSVARWECDSNISSVSMRSWKANWFFKEKNTISPYDNLGHKVFHSDNEESVMMFVPKTGVPKVQIGARDVDEMSELSENRSEISDLSDFDEEDNEASEELQQVTGEIVSEFLQEENSDGEGYSSSFAKTGLAPSLNSDSESEREERLRKRRSAKTRSAHKPVDKLQRDRHAEQSPSTPVPAPRRTGGKDRSPKAMESPRASSTPVEKKPAVKKSAVVEVVEKGTECADIKFNVKPRTASVSEGQCATFTTEINSAESLDVFWYRDFGDRIEQLEHSEKYEILEKGKIYSLEIYDCSPKDYGQYMCIAANENGSSNWSFGLKVKEESIDMVAPEFIKGISDLERIEGQSAKFRVKVKGYPHPRVLWYKDGRLLENSLVYRIERVGNRDYTLSLDYLTLDNDAEYTVAANNRAGKVKSTAQLLVEAKPDEEEERSFKSPSKYSLSSKPSPKLTQTKNLSLSKQKPRDRSPVSRQESMDGGLPSGQMSPDSAIFSSVDTDGDRHREEIIKQYTDVKASAAAVKDMTTSALNVLRAAEKIVQSESKPSESEANSPAPVYKSLRDAYRRPPSQDMDFTMTSQEPQRTPSPKKASAPRSPSKKSSEKSFTISSPALKKQESLDTSKSLPPQMSYDEFQKQYELVGDDTISRGTQKTKHRGSLGDVLDVDSHNLSGASIQPFVDCGLKQVDSRRYSRDYVVNRSPLVERKKWDVSSTSSSHGDVVRQSSEQTDEIYLDAEFPLEDRIKKFLPHESPIDNSNVVFHSDKGISRRRLLSSESPIYEYRETSKPSASPVLRVSPKQSPTHGVAETFKTSTSIVLGVDPKDASPTVETETFKSSGSIVLSVGQKQSSPHNIKPVLSEKSSNSTILNVDTISQNTKPLMSPPIKRSIETEIQEVTDQPISPSWKRNEKITLPIPVESEALKGQSSADDIANSRSEYGQGINQPSVRNLMSRFGGNVKKTSEPGNKRVAQDFSPEVATKSELNVSSQESTRKEKIRNKLLVSSNTDETSTSELDVAPQETVVREKIRNKLLVSASADTPNVDLDKAPNVNTGKEKIRNKLWVSSKTDEKLGSSVAPQEKIPREKIRNKLWVSDPSDAGKAGIVDHQQKSLPQEVQVAIPDSKLSSQPKQLENKGVKETDILPKTEKSNDEPTNSKVLKGKGKDKTSPIKETTEQSKETKQEGSGKKKTVIRRIIRKIIRKKTPTEPKSPEPTSSPLKKGSKTELPGPTSSPLKKGSKTELPGPTSSPLKKGSKTELPGNDEPHGSVKLVSFHSKSLDSLNLVANEEGKADVNLASSKQEPVANLTPVVESEIPANKGGLSQDEITSASNTLLYDNQMPLSSKDVDPRESTQINDSANTILLEVDSSTHDDVEHNESAEFDAAASVLVNDVFEKAVQKHQCETVAQTLLDDAVDGAINQLNDTDLQQHDDLATFSENDANAKDSLMISNAHRLSELETSGTDGLVSSGGSTTNDNTLVENDSFCDNVDKITCDQVQSHAESVSLSAAEESNVNALASIEDQGKNEEVRLADVKRDVDVSELPGVSEVVVGLTEDGEIANGQLPEQEDKAEVDEKKDVNDNLKAVGGAAQTTNNAPKKPPRRKRRKNRR